MRNDIVTCNDSHNEKHNHIFKGFPLSAGTFCVIVLHCVSSSTISTMNVLAFQSSNMAVRTTTRVPSKVDHFKKFSKSPCVWFDCVHGLVSPGTTASLSSSVVNGPAIHTGGQAASGTQFQLQTHQSACNNSAALSSYIFCHSGATRQSLSSWALPTFFSCSAVGQ
ncbi:hypothetical protein Mal52_42030 [Symmachiella dynata]|uniref:Uncharacterized protein n=1 Tax=Symmachiella dynata TaxID=2527995 RepID=A0A517ZT92_9PLAN|nr:hypothetical protein Mal52_42030 [Symmachiella dynata]